MQLHAWREKNYRNADDIVTNRHNAGKFMPQGQQKDHGLI